MRFLSGLILISACGLFAQTFEVATVKPNVSGDGRVQIEMNPGGRFRALNTTLRMLIEQAYDIKGFQLTGTPGWVDSEHFDVNAKADDSTPGMMNSETLRTMLRALIEERFKLTMHKESKEMPVYALVVAKNGLKMQKSAIEPPDPSAPREPGQRGPMMRMGRGQLSGQGVEVAMLVNNLSRNLGRQVIDKTGLTGRYDFKLEWTPDSSQMPRGMGDPGEPKPRESAPAESGPTLFTALQEQLGLKLESQKGPVDLFVVDHVEKPAEN